MIRAYCGACGQEMTTCECPEDERIPLLNMTQKDFDRSITEAYRLGLDVMGERVSDLKVAVEVTARNSYQEGHAVGRIDGETSMRERAADLCAEAINAVRPTGRWDPEVRGAQNEAERLERAIRALEADVEEKPCRHVCIDCGLAFRPSARCRLCTKGHDREQLRKRRAICQCGSAAKDRACKMDCPGSEVKS